MSRVNSTIKNVIFSYIAVIPSTILNIITRYFFIRYLSVEYLGASGLFTSIFAILSFADLGIGEAITFKLYKPLAEKDHLKVSQLMHFYKLFYQVLTIFVFVTGLCFITFLPKLTNNSTLDNLVLIYILYLINTALGYFNADKKSFLIANQQSWVNNIIQNTFLCIQYVLQLIVIVVTRNFLIYLLIQLLCQFLTGLYVAFYLRKHNTTINYKNNMEPLGKDEKKSLFKNSGALFIHKIGDLVFNNITSVFISANLGLLVMGYYSNYLMIINMVIVLLSYLTMPTQASIGNLCASIKDTNYLELVLKRMEFLLYFIYSTVSVLLLSCFSLIIKIYAGKEYFGFSLILLLVANFMVTGMKIIISQFKTVSGLFTKDVFRPIAEASIYLVVGTVFIRVFGIEGLILAFMSIRLFSNTLIERMLVYKHLLHKPVLKSYVEVIIKILLTLTIGSLFSFLLNNLYILNNLITLILKASLTLFLYLVIFLLLYYKNQYFKYWLNVAKEQVQSLFIKLTNGGNHE